MSTLRVVPDAIDPQISAIDDASVALEQIGVLAELVQVVHESGDRAWLGDESVAITMVMIKQLVRHAKGALSR